MIKEYNGVLVNLFIGGFFMYTLSDLKKSTFYPLISNVLLSHHGISEALTRNLSHENGEDKVVLEFLINMDTSVDRKEKLLEHYS